MPAVGISIVSSVGPPLVSWTSLNEYESVPGNLNFTGWARSVQNPFIYTVSSYSKANPGVVTTSADHGLISDNFVRIYGATGDWAAVNGTQKIIVVTSATFSIAINTTAYTGTFNGVIETTCPRTGAACWAISKNVYDAGGQLLRSMWVSGSPGDSFVWDNRATLSYS